MSVEVVLTEDAVADLDEIHRHIAEADGISRADAVIDGISSRLAKLADFPNADEHPPELLALGIREFRQAHHKPWRAIYRVDAERGFVHVLLVSDGRRDFRMLLQRRLLSG